MSRRRTNTSSVFDSKMFINDASKFNTSEPAKLTGAFSDFNLDPRLADNIRAKGYTIPTEVQSKSIGKAIKGTDLVGIAGTGTGKTAAFLIPLIERLSSKRTADYAIIIAPTRELALQISEEFKSLSKGMGLYSTCLIGGTSVRNSIKSLKRKNHVIIGTPGRIQDMASQRFLDYDHFRFLVLDEFDRMLDMGFSTEIMRINQKMVNKEQTLLFSATIDSTQSKLIDEITFKPIRIHCKRVTPNTNAIDQKVIHTNGLNKLNVLTDLLTESVGVKTILFCETKRKADKLSKRLGDYNFSAGAIHGDKSQRQRENTLANFKRGQINILVATDVVARGIDVKDVDLVINYQPPREYSDYIHRIGRTGRAGKTGRAITLID